MAATVTGGRWKMAPHLALLDRELTAIATGKTRRLIVQMPPRHGKSMLCGQYFPAWYLGVFPDRNIMYASYEAGQAAKYGRLARNVMQQHGARLFGLQVASDSHAAERWNIAGHEGGMVTAGAGGPLTGKGADVLIVDDPVKNAEQAISEVFRNKVWEWWESTALTRLEPRGSVVVIMTRWHRDDLAGRCLRDMKNEDWRVINLPALATQNCQLGRKPGEALWPQRYSRADLERIRDNRSLYWWLSLYQQQPARHAAVEWPARYFNDIYFETWPATLGARIITLDPSKGRSRHSDYSAYVMLGRGADGTYYADANLQRRSAGEMVDDGVELCRSFQPEALGIEGNAWQDLLAPMFEPRLRELNINGCLVHTIENFSVAKVNRIRRIDPHLRAGRLKIRNTPGGRLLVSQLAEFPLAAHDDGPDALEMALRWAETMQG